MKSSKKRSSIQPGRGRSAKSGYKAGKSSRNATEPRGSRRESSERTFKITEKEDGPSKSPFAPAYRTRKSSSEEERPIRRRTSDGDDRRKSSDENKSYRKRSTEGSERRERSRDDKPFRKFSSDDKKPFRKKRDEGSERRERSGDDKPFRKFASDDKKPFRKSRDEGSERRVRSGDDKPFRKYASDDRKPFHKNREERPDRRERSDDDKPFRRSSDREESRSVGVKGRASDKMESRFDRDERSTKKPSWFGEGERSEKRFKRDEKPFGEKKWNRKESHQFYGEKKKKSFGKKSSATAADEGLVRLNRFIANAGICSRREADELIKAGVISVNGNVVTEMGFKVQPGDAVKYNNSVLRGEELKYVLLNKPKDFITTTDDPDDRKTVMSLVSKACRERIYPVGRLDRNTTGVLLFTNDGDLAKKLTHPSFQVQKVYQVELDKNLKQADFEAIENGLKLEDGFIKVDDIVYGSEKHILGVELHSGKNRIVRRIFESLGYEVKKLDRVVFAGLTKKDLPRGRYRALTDLEVASLKMQVGKKATV